MHDWTQILLDNAEIPWYTKSIMERTFLLQKLERVIYIGEDEYSEKKTSFYNNTWSQELIYVLSGESTVYFEDEILYERPDTIRYLPRVDPLHRYDVFREKPGEYIVINFQSETPLFEKTRMICSQNERLRTLFKKAFSVWVKKEEGYYYESVSIFYKILAELERTSYIPDRLYEKIRPAVEYIESHFTECEVIRSKKLEELCSISYSYIKRLFAKRFQTSPKDYVISLKIHYACELLQHTDYTVSQIARMCGYGDVFFFSRQFKGVLGISPSAFRDKYVSTK